MRRLHRVGIEVLVPKSDDQNRINKYGELCRGEIVPGSRAFFLDVIEALAAQGAQGIVLGCTELPLLMRPADCALPLFDTSVLHAERALQYAIQQPEST